MVVRATPGTTERTRVRFMLQISLNHQPQNSYVNMPLFSHQNARQIGGTVTNSAQINREIAASFRAMGTSSLLKKDPAAPALGLLVAAYIRSCRETKISEIGFIRELDVLSSPLRLVICCVEQNGPGC
jgi:hypothetical protein